MSVRWTEEDLARAQRRMSEPPKAKPSKYRNTPVEWDGERYDSKLEARCAQWLKARWLDGVVAWYTRQVSFRLEGGVRYKCDFLAALVAGGIEVIDAKGKHETQVSKNKRKQMKDRYGIDVLLWPRDFAQCN